MSGIPITEDELEVRSRRARATEPAKRWRNRYRANTAWVCRSGVTWGPGEYLAPPIWPSKEIAETKGIGWMQDASGHPYGVTIKYLGAEPAP